MNVDVIQTQYDALGNIADRFGHWGEATTTLRGRLQTQMQALQQGGWEGRAATAFFAEMEQDTLPAMQRLKEALTKAQSVTLQAKTVIQNAEREAAAPFQGSAAVGGLLGAAANTLAGSVPGASSATVTSVVSAIGNMLKGVAANVLLPQQFILRSMSPNLARGQTTVAALMDMLAGKPGRGLPLIRFDGPHSGSPFPHINLNPKLTGFKDPHMPISPRLLNFAGRGARILEGVQKIALPAAIAIDVFRVGSAFHSDGNQIGDQTKQTVGSVAGGWAGAFVGAKAGAVGGAWLGGAIGSVVPGVGTAVGAGVGGFLGGLAGGIGGALGGSSLGEMVGGLF